MVSIRSERLLAERQERALTRPLARANLGPDALAPYREVRRHRAGFLLVSILAVDR